LRLEFYDARVWRYVVSAISKIIEEGVFIIDPDTGLSFRAMDPSHIIMLSLSFPKDSFEAFDVGEKARVGVNFDDLAKVLRRARKDDRLELSIEGNSFSVVFRGRSLRSFTLPVLEVGVEEIPEPELEFKAFVKVMSDTYRDTIKDVELVGDVIRFVASGDEFKVLSSSEFGEAEIIYTRDSGILLDMDVEDTQQASYTLDYFSDLSPAARVADTVSIRFTSDMPAEVAFDLPQGAEFKFLIAPRVE